MTGSSVSCSLVQPLDLKGIRTSMDLNAVSSKPSGTSTDLWLRAISVAMYEVMDAFIVREDRSKTYRVGTGSRNHFTRELATRDRSGIDYLPMLFHANFGEVQDALRAFPDVFRRQINAACACEPSRSIRILVPSRCLLPVVDIVGSV